MKAPLPFLLAALLASQALAAPQTFVNGGLKIESVVKLDVTGKVVRGTFLTSEYDRQHARAVPFSGSVVPTPKGKTGVWLEITFDKAALAGDAAPNSLPPTAKRVTWTLRIVDHHAHLFIPMRERSYESTPAKLVVNEVEFTPDP